VDNQYPDKQFRYYDLIMAAFVCVMLCSNLIGAGKVVEVAGVSFGAAVLFFPISYLFGDILTEVYGYARARRVVWAGFAAMIFASFMSWIILKLPAAPTWTNQAAFETVFGATWRIVLGSLVAFFCGEFCNSYLMAKLKILTAGKYLWMRAIGSTVLGEAIDSIVFYPLAFYGIWPEPLLIRVMITAYVIKVVWEILSTPLTYVVVNWLKRVEQEDFFDYNTDFNPFSLKVADKRK
jgi:uncharacterized integral membrane protein (TIGR00697 family)